MPDDLMALHGGRRGRGGGSGGWWGASGEREGVGVSEIPSPDGHVDKTSQMCWITVDSRHWWNGKVVDGFPVLFPISHISQGRMREMCIFQSKN